MINQNEIRSGNLFQAINRSAKVHITDGPMLKVWTIDFFEVEALLPGVNPATVENIPKIRISDLSPIGLNPEILEKSGFRPIPTFTVMNSMTLSVDRNRYLSIGNIGTPNEVMFLCGTDDDLICIHNYDYNGKLYLHTLQNWYKLLTGQELAIKI